MVEVVALEPRGDDQTDRVVVLPEPRREVRGVTDESVTSETLTTVVLLRAERKAALTGELWSSLITWRVTELVPTEEKIRPKREIRMIGKIKEKNRATGLRK